MKIKHMIIFILFIISAVIGYAYFIERNILIVEKRNFKLECVKKTTEKRIVHISDLHFNKSVSSARINRIYEKIKNLDPNIIFITGDLIDNKNGIEKTKELINKISAISPVYLVFGNWDYYVLKYNIKEFKNELEKSGAKILMNKAEKIKIGEEEFNIIGIDSYAEKNETINAETGVCQILIAHSPNIIYKAAEKNIDLVLVGHTHGGQIYIPFITKSIIPVEPEFKKFLAGDYKEKNTQIYVNRGIGTSTLPLRFLAPPEITLITLE